MKKHFWKSKEVREKYRERDKRETPEKRHTQILTETIRLNGCYRNKGKGKL